ncbi:hypothetical protein SADUNF_Sadunf10G0064600 [Salix dunnii]|uniref:Uncharacterized protein n=1 Tax=Salix dunnii TaxID=1413687 RepID=A0A835JSP4_9ROSI|nr:hypothetical protein SADUNF_Sadunf10G0064600 [Salix dunnii]
MPVLLIPLPFGEYGSNNNDLQGGNFRTIKINSKSSVGYLVHEAVSRGETNWKCNHLLPHFFPACLFLMLQRFGMVRAIPGLIPACFARGDSIIAHRHFGAVLIKAATLEQQVGGTAALAFPAAPKHGLKLAAADLIGVFPHSPPA